MVPDWHHELGVPTVGDSVRILAGDVITIDPNENIHTNVQLSVQPKSHDGVLTERAQAIADLLQANHALTEKLINRYLNSPISTDAIGELKVNLKNVLENYRSSLEYVAHYMADYCNPRPDLKRIQFPAANVRDNEVTFSKKLDDWFPNLGTIKPAVKDYIISIQHFKGDYWLQELVDLSNINKHQTLSLQQTKEFESILISYDVAGFRLGNLGLMSVEIQKDAALTLKGLKGNELSISGPCKLDINNVPTTTFDDGITVVREQRDMHYLPESSNSLVHMVWVISKNVYRTVHNVCSLLS